MVIPPSLPPSLPPPELSALPLPSALLLPWPSLVTPPLLPSAMPSLPPSLPPVPSHRPIASAASPVCSERVPRSIAVGTAGIATSTGNGPKVSVSTKGMSISTLAASVTVPSVVSVPASAPKPSRVAAQVPAYCVVRVPPVTSTTSVAPGTPGIGTEPSSAGGSIVIAVAGVVSAKGSKACETSCRPYSKESTTPSKFAPVTSMRALSSKAMPPESASTPLPATGNSEAPSVVACSVTVMAPFAVAVARTATGESAGKKPLSKSKPGNSPSSPWNSISAA